MQMGVPSLTVAQRILTGQRQGGQDRCFAYFSQQSRSADRGQMPVDNNKHYIFNHAEPCPPQH